MVLTGMAFAGISCSGERYKSTLGPTHLLTQTLCLCMLYYVSQFDLIVGQKTHYDTYSIKSSLILSLSVIVG